jgi:hypothetical protein
VFVYTELELAVRVGHHAYRNLPPAWIPICVKKRKRRYNRALSDVQLCMLLGDDEAVMTGIA